MPSTPVALGWHTSVELTSTMVLAFAPLILIAVGLVVYCLVDLARAPSVRYLPKPVWALVIVIGSCPLGALAYLIFGRDRDNFRRDGNDDSRGPEGAAATTDDNRDFAAAGVRRPT